MIILQHVCSRPRRVPVLVWPPVKGFGSSGPVFRFALSSEEGTAVLQSLRFRRMIQYQHHRMHVCANSSRYAVSSVSTLVGECTTETNIVQADSEIPYFKVGVAIAFEYDADRRVGERTQSAKMGCDWWFGSGSAAFKGRGTRPGWPNARSRYPLSSS